MKINGIDRCAVNIEDDSFLSMSEKEVLIARAVKSSRFSIKIAGARIISGRDAELIYFAPMADGQRDSW